MENHKPPSWTWITCSVLFCMENIFLPCLPLKTHYLVKGIHVDFTVYMWETDDLRCFSAGWAESQPVIICFWVPTCLPYSYQRAPFMARSE